MTDKSADHLLEYSHFRAAVMDDKSSVRELFLDDFASEIEACCIAAHGTYVSFKQMTDKLPLTERVSLTEFFVYQAINSVVTSLSLLITGRLVPSGNLMRHYGEATAMAFLCCHPSIPEYGRFMANPMKYPVHKAMTSVSKPKYRKLLNINAANWAEFTKLTSFYDKLSHAGAMTLADATIFAQPGMVSLGGDFDSDKLDQYKIELSRRQSAAEVLDHGIPIIGSHLRAAV